MKLPVPPPTAEHARFYSDVVAVLRSLMVPTGPLQLWGVDQADLPPAADSTACAVYVTDLDVIAVSNGTSWIRQDDGSAL